MVLKYYGTAAAEGFPGIFCECDACRRARLAGGRNIRTRTQATVDDILLIDFPPDTLLHVFYGGLNLSKIHDCIITHSHTDHYYPDEFENRKPGYAWGELGSLTIYGGSAAAELFAAKDRQRHFTREDRVIFKTISVFTPFKAAGFTITALAANHAPETTPVFYLIEKAGIFLLYANDTGYFPDETWAYLEKTCPILNIASFDCTEGLKKAKKNHMGMPDVIGVRKRLKAMGCIGDDTVCILHHFTHNCGSTYDDMEKPAAENNFLVSYDGMEVWAE
jgi:phosphoribosyl 1,2-cyclic phosphate phosphodiesterase